MPTPGEHKTVHPPPLKLRRTGAWILECAEVIHHRQGYGGTRGKSPSLEHIRNVSHFFDDVLNPYLSSAIGYGVAGVRVSKPRYTVKGRCPEAPGFGHLHTDITTGPS